MIPANWMSAGRFGDDGAKASRTSEPFYEFRLDDMIPKGHLLRRINVFVTSVLGDLHEQLGPFYSDIGRPSIDPELLIRMLIIGTASASAPRGSCARR